MLNRLLVIYGLYFLTLTLERTSQGHYYFSNTFVGLIRNYAILTV